MQTMKEIFDEIEASGGLTPSRRLKDIANRFPDQVAFRDKSCLLYTSPSPRDDR